MCCKISLITALDQLYQHLIQIQAEQLNPWNCNFKNGRLTFLWLYDDSLSGEIPESIGKLTFLDTLHLSYNQLTGNLPKSIGRLTRLNWLYLYRNQLSGMMPDSLCNIYLNLTNAYFAYNQFCPPYPGCVPIEKISAQDISNCP